MTDSRGVSPGLAAPLLVIGSMGWAAASVDDGLTLMETVADRIYRRMVHDAGGQIVEVSRLREVADVALRGRDVGGDMINSLRRLEALGQSIWLDDLHRDRLDDGTQAVDSTDRYLDDIAGQARSGGDSEAIYEHLVIEDVRRQALSHWGAQRQRLLWTSTSAADVVQGCECTWCRCHRETPGPAGEDRRSEAGS